MSQSNAGPIRALCVATAGMLIPSVLGCAGMDTGGTGRGGRSNGMSSHLTDVPAAAAFEHGVAAMSEWFRRVDQRPTEGVAHGVMTEYPQRGGTERLRDTIGFRNHMRRTGLLTIQPRGTGCVVTCRIDRERLDTADHRVFRQNDTLNDVPNDTPIDRNAGISASQDQVWTPMPRDRALERKILMSIKARSEAVAASRRPND